MKVLLPACCADDAKLILDFVANYRWVRGSEFKVLHVVGSCADEESMKAAVKQASQLVRQITDKLQAILPECQVLSEVLTGMPVFEILQQAKQWQANMIVMGFRTNRLLNEIMAGSVSRGVTLQAPCSVVVIRPPQLSDSAVASSPAKSLTQSS